jgi:hypothetical protein
MPGRRCNEVVLATVDGWKIRLPDSLQKMDERATLRLTASLRADCRLLLICDQLLDSDIQPIPEDFVVAIGEERHPVIAVQLESPLPQDANGSALLLQTATPLPKTDRLRLIYRPTQWLMWSAVYDRSVAPFEHIVPADDKSLAEYLEQWPELDAASPDHAPGMKANSAADSERVDVQAVGDNAVVVSEAVASPLAALRAPRAAENKTTLDRVVAILILCALSAGGVLVVLLLYIGIKFFGGGFFAQPEVAKPKVVTVCNLEFPNGDRYEGQCVDGVGDGQGVYYSQSGDRYVGGWSRQNRHGAGILTTADGKIMEGHWRNGVAYDTFTIKWPNGTHYVGQVDGDLPNGEGTMTFANGDSYTGQFVKNVKHGQGLMKWANGISYEGRYENDVPNGFGIYKLADGSRFEGMFVDGQVTQNGTCYHFDGSNSRGPCQ